MSPELLSNVRKGIRLMHDYAESLGMPEIEADVTVYVYRDMDKLVDAHHEVTGEPKNDIRRWAANLPGYAFDTAIFINASVLRESSPDDQTYIAAHELNHDQRNYLTRSHRTHRSGHTRYSEPAWFDEGIAIYLGWHAVSADGVSSYEARRRLAKEALGSVELDTLKDLETRDGFDLHGDNGFHYSMLAVELLAAYVGQSSLIGFYTSLGLEVTWAERFEVVFGISAEEFYATFKAHQEAGFPTPKAAFGPGELSERATLIALYRATDGPNWAQNTNWLSDAPVGEWHGVTTDSGGRVTKLELGDNRLSGQLPAKLGSLSELRVLSLGGNRLSGDIPGWLGGLPNLSVLDLADNRFDGKIPSELGGLSKLTNLDLGSNELSEGIPAELGNLSSLTNLDLGDNQLSGGIPAGLGGLATLRVLDLGDNWLSGEIPGELSDLYRLTVLHLGGNQLNGAIPAALGRLSNLQGVYFVGNRLSGCIPAGLRDVESNDLANLGLSFGRAQADGESPDRNALVVLYNVTGGPNWAKNKNWLSDAPMCEWHGVATDSSGRVTDLDLGDNRLNGTIPAELSSLSRLSLLDLGENLMSGVIPAELGALSELRQLNLNSNQLSGEMPAGLGTLSELRQLRLDRNRLSGRDTDAGLGTMYELRELHLDSNQLSGAIPAELGKLSDLRELILSYNQLSGAIPVELGNLSNLRILYIRSNAFTGRIPVELGRLLNLEQLSLRYNELSGPIPAELGNLSNLTWLGLRDNELSGPIPPELGRLSKLTWLGIDNNRLTGRIPAELGRLADLKHLGLENNRLSGEIPAELGSLSILESLVLSGNELSGRIPFELGSLTRLWGLQLSGNSLSGCVPQELWRRSDYGDVEDLGLPVCGGSAALQTRRIVKCWWRFTRLRMVPTG